MRDLIDRAACFGIKVYAPVIYQYTGTPESEAGLRRLVQDLLREFPDIRGYVLLTEGFWYGTWGGAHGASREYVENWAREWSRAVAIVAVNPGTAPTKSPNAAEQTITSRTYGLTTRS